MISYAGAFLVALAVFAYTFALVFALEWHAGRRERERLRRFLAEWKAREAFQAARLTGEARAMMLARCDAYDRVAEFVNVSRWSRYAEDERT